VLSGWQAFVAAILAVSSLSITLSNVINISYFSGFTVFTTPSGRARNIPTPRLVPLKDPITGSLVNQKIGSQRRRLGVGG
jgi:hypothetical protein